jgi:nicotinamidase/pyrazinamidase
MEKALLIIDFQNDFTPGGALAVPRGDDIAPQLNRLAEAFDTVIATRDWHPPDHSSFAEQGGPWPVHCVQGSEGAQLHPALRREGIDRVVDKGQDRATDGYSGFEGTGLEGLLRERGVEEVFVCGLATDYCVKNTALDAVRHGFGVTVVHDAAKGVEMTPGDSERALEEVRAAGARVTSTDEVIGEAGRD